MELEKTSGVKSKELNVVITGRSGTGKSTMGLHLVQLLSLNGFDVEFDDPETKQDVMILKNNKENIKSLKDHVKINITTAQEKR